MPAIALHELERHVPRWDGKMVGCSCGWQGKETPGNWWLKWLFHLPEFTAEPLNLTALDRAFMRRVHIKDE